METILGEEKKLAEDFDQAELDRLGVAETKEGKEEHGQVHLYIHVVR